MNPHQPVQFKIQKSENHAFLVQVDECSFFYNNLHYHPEFQITAIVRGDGILYAGNNMISFGEKDVFLIGVNVPHLLKCSERYFLDRSPGVKGVSLFFDKYSLGQQFFEIKELERLGDLLNDSSKVIKIDGELKDAIFKKIIDLQSAKDEQLFISLLEVLSLMRRADKTYINNHQYNLILNTNEGSRLNQVLDYTFENFEKEIKIEQVAKIAFLSRSQFSYFFKLHTGKSYIKFLNEIRIENACILLKNKVKTIEQICYDVGFQNVSNFTRHFKAVKGVTPSGYRKSWKL